MTKRMNSGMEYRDDNYYKQLYGQEAVITRLGQRTLVHLDNPSPKEIQRRKKEIMHEEVTGEAYDDDCPLCQELKNQPHDIVYFKQD